MLLASWSSISCPPSKWPLRQDPPLVSLPNTLLGGVVIAVATKGTRAPIVCCHGNVDTNIALALVLVGLLRQTDYENDVDVDNN